MVADEVDDREAVLALACAQPAAELVQKTTGDSVGRSISTVSISGTSSPSLKMSTQNTISIRPSRNAVERDTSLNPLAITASTHPGCRPYEVERRTLLT